MVTTGISEYGVLIDSKHNGRLYDMSYSDTLRVPLLLSLHVYLIDMIN